MTRTAFLTFVFLLVTVACHAQIPEPADTLGNWTKTGSPVETYVDTVAGDTLHVLGDSTWVALQSQTTVGCDTGPDGSFWTFTIEGVRGRIGGMLRGTELVPNDHWQSYESCIWYVQYLWDVLPDGECDACG